MTVCAMFGCKNRMHKGCGKHFFRFPMKDPERLAKWIEAVQRDDWTPTVHSKVCSDHFTEKDYMIRPGAACPYLRMDAVPVSLFPVQRRRKTKKRKYTRKSVGEIQVTIQNDGPDDSMMNDSHEMMMEVQDAHIQVVLDRAQEEVEQSMKQLEEVRGRKQQEAERCGKPGEKAQSKEQEQAVLSEKQAEVQQSEHQGEVLVSKKQVEVTQKDKEGEVAQNEKQGEVVPGDKQVEVTEKDKEGEIGQCEVVPSEKHMGVSQKDKEREVAQGEKQGEVVPSEKQMEVTQKNKEGEVAQSEKQGEVTHREELSPREKQVANTEKLGVAVPSENPVEETQNDDATEMLVDVEDTQGRRNMDEIQTKLENAETENSSPPSDKGAEYIPVDHAYSAVTSDKENDIPAPSGNPKIVKLRKKIKTLQKQVLRQGVKIKSLKQTLVDLRRNNLVEKDPERVLSEHCSGLALALFTNQLKNGHKRYNAIQYCSLMKEFALNLYYASPKAYKFCRLFLCLPHPVSLRHWKTASEANPPVPVQAEPLPEDPVQGEPLQEGPVQGEPLQEGPVQGEVLQDGQLQGEALQEEPVQGQFLQEGSL